MRFDMVTKKDFKAIAEIIKNKTSHVNPQLLFIPTIDLARKLADYFATQNPRFDRQKFLDACGL